MRLGVVTDTGDAAGTIVSEKKYVIDWSQVLEPAGNRFKTLYDPFGQSYSEWEDSNSARPDVNRLLYMLHRVGDNMDIG